MNKPINNITTEDVAFFRSTQTLNAYQVVSQQSAIYPGQGTFVGLMYTNAKLNGEAGEFSENVGKALRDDNVMTSIVAEKFKDTFCFSELSHERRDKLILELGDVLWYVAASAKELGVTLEEVAHRNIMKLFDRGQRGKLQGSGDER